MTEPESKAGWDLLRSVVKGMESDVLTAPDPETLKVEALHRKRLDEFQIKYPNCDGTEFAFITPDGELCIQYVAKSGDKITHGSDTYAKDDAEFEAEWRRHKMDEAAGRTHFIVKRWNDQLNEWDDVTDQWSDS